MRSQLLHQQFKDSGAPQVDYNQVVRLTYSMAIIRFVNRITEKQQNQHYAKPVHNIAEELGIPHWLVRLRHDAAHNELPSMCSLEMGVKFALLFLKKKFWEPQFQVQEVEEDKNSMTKDEQEANSVQNFRDLLLQYQQARFCDMGRKRRPGKPSAPTQAILEEIKSHFPHHDKRGAVFLLCEEGFLIATELQLSALNINKSNLLEEWDQGLPPNLLVFWRPLLRLLHGIQSMMSMLLLRLAALPPAEPRICLPPSCLLTRLAAGWVYCLLSSCGQKDWRGKEKPCLPLFEKMHQVFLPVDGLWSLCREKQHHFCCHIMALLVPEKEANDEEYTEALWHMDIFCNGWKRGREEDSTEESKAKKARTTLDTAELVAKANAIIEKKKAEKRQIAVHPVTGCWDWGSTPLGLCPWQKEPDGPFYLDLLPPPFAVPQSDAKMAAERVPDSGDLNEMECDDDSGQKAERKEKDLREERDLTVKTNCDQDTKDRSTDRKMDSSLKAKIVRDLVASIL